MDMTRRRFLALSALVPPAWRLQRRFPEGTILGKPNIVLLVTDDMRRDEWQYMAQVQQKLAAKGTWLPNYTVTNPVCGPSRLTMLTGFYSHHHGVMSNDDSGENPFALSHPFESQMLPVVLGNAGYRTGLFGKYLNGYDGSAYIPPGWDRWVAFSQGKYYNTTVNEDGRLWESVGYQPLVVGQKALSWVQSELAAHRPFFAYVCPYAPHGPAAYEPRFAALFPELSGIRRDRARSLQTVDEWLGQLYGALNDAGQAGNTYVFAVSDNGFCIAEHGFTGKFEPWEACVSTGGYVRGPAIPRAASNGALVGNIDLASTIARIAGMAPMGDGVSAIDTLTLARPLREWIGIEGPGKGAGAEWRGVRSVSEKYVEYTDGEVALFNTATDPGEMVNLALTVDVAPYHALLEASP